MQNSVGIHNKDSSLSSRWAEKSKHMSVSATFFHFDSEERIEKYIDAQFLTTEEKDRYKWYREEWYRRPKEFDPGPQPLSVICELVSSCNLNCNMCYTVKESFQSAIVGAQRMLPWTQVKAIIDEAADLGVPSMLFSWRGESSLYRSKSEGQVYTLPDVLKYAREAGILEITCLTHGQLLNEEMARQICEAEPSWISFSIDGLESAYNKIRTPKNKQNDPVFSAFELTIQNIKFLRNLRDEMGKSRPQLRCNTIYPAIAHDPYQYYDYMKNIGIDLVSVNELLEWSHYDSENLPPEVIDLDWGCQYPFQRLTVSANGTIIPCNGAVKEEKGLVLGRYKGSKPKKNSYGSNSGSIIQNQEETLKSAWFSEKLSEIRYLHKEKRRTEITSGCLNCIHGTKKRGVDWIPENWNDSSMDWNTNVK